MKQLCLKLKSKKKFEKKKLDNKKKERKGDSTAPPNQLVKV